MVSYDLVMDLKKTIVLFGLVMFLAGPASAALNGTAVALIVSEAFIIVTTILQETVDIVPLLIELGIMFAILTLVLGFFTLILLAFRKGVSGGLR